MARIEVSTEALQRLSDEIRASGNRMGQCNDKIRKYLMELRDTWDSPAGDTLFNQIANELDFLQISRRTIYEYGEFVGVTAMLYESNEEKQKVKSSFI